MTRAKATYAIEAVDKTKDALRSIDKNLKGVDKAFKAVMAAGAVVLGARGIGAGFKSTVIDSAKALDEVAKAANRLGTDVGTIAGFTHATKLAGAEAGDLELAWKKAGKTLADAARGAGEARPYLEKLGISVTTATGSFKSADQVMFEFADQLSKLDGEAEVTAATMAIFGESGTKLLPMLRQGSQAIREQVAEGRALAMVTEDMTRKAEAFNDAQLRLDTATRAAANVLTTVFMPALSDVAEKAAWKLVEAVSGLNKEVSLSLAKLATYDDKAFFAAARDEAEMLSSALTEAQQKWFDLTKLEGEWKTGSWVEQWLHGLRGDWKWISEEIKTAADEMNDLHVRQQAFGRIVDMRLPKIQAEAAAAKVTREQLKKQVILSDQLIKLDRVRLMTRIGMVEQEEDLAQRQKDALGFLKDEYKGFLDELEMPEFDLENFAKPTQISRVKAVLDDIGETVKHGLAHDLSAGLAQFVVEGKTQADFFKNVWKNTIDEIVRYYTQKFLLNQVFPFLGDLVGSLFSTATPVLANAATRAPVQPVTIVQNSLVPGTTADYVRAFSAVQEAARQKSRFTLSGRATL